MMGELGGYVDRKVVTRGEGVGGGTMSGGGSVRGGVGEVGGSRRRSGRVERRIWEGFLARKRG
jgi:hypothetical protein